MQLYHQFIPKYDRYKAGQVEGGGNSVEVLFDSVGSLVSMVGLSSLLLLLLLLRFFMLLNGLSTVDVEQCPLSFFLLFVVVFSLLFLLPFSLGWIVSRDSFLLLLFF